MKSVVKAAAMAQDDNRFKKAMMFGIMKDIRRANRALCDIKMLKELEEQTAALQGQKSQDTKPKEKPAWRVQVDAENDYISKATQAFKKEHGRFPRFKEHRAIAREAKDWYRTTR